MDELYSLLMKNGAADADGEHPDTEGTEDRNGSDYIRVVFSVLQDINSLTFNRIEDFSALTQFQRDTIVRVCNRFIQFKLNNAELLNSVMKSYSINGVSMSFGGEGLMCVKEIYIPGDIYALLRQTGLTCRVI